MKRPYTALKSSVWMFSLLFIIFDSKTALSGAKEGINMCLNSVIPALFPAMIVSDFFIRSTTNNPTIISNIFSALNLPIDAGSYFLTGALCGYPTGARLIGQSYNEKKLTCNQAEVYLQFCNNAGPAFIFGICGPMFQSRNIPVVIWIIHILSSLLIAILICSKGQNIENAVEFKKLSFGQILSNSIKTMASVCGWIILFRTVLAFLHKWFLWILPIQFSVVISGLLELTNGALNLCNIQNNNLRMITCCFLLSFGGFCVTMQTASLTIGLSLRKYLSSKIIQSFISILLCMIYIKIDLVAPSSAITLISLIAIYMILIVLIINLKKYVAFPGKVIYNTEKVIKG